MANDVLIDQRTLVGAFQCGHSHDFSLNIVVDSLFVS